MKDPKTITPLGHIKSLVADVERLISQKEDFVAFIILALGTEFLGSFYDAEPFTKHGMSDSRFKNAIKKLFKTDWYKSNLKWMYKEFRGPLVHQYRTSPEILLTSVCKNGASLTDHLKLEGEKRIFVLEQYFDDYKQALETLDTLIAKNNHSLNKEKLECEYMQIVKVENENGTYIASGTTENIVIKVKKK